MTASDPKPGKMESIGPPITLAQAPHRASAWNGSKKGQEDFPTNQDPTNILGRMDLHYDFFLGGGGVGDSRFQISRFLDV